MAQARTRLWFLPTSPRSPDKIRPELGILQAFEGAVWDRAGQAEFFRHIVDSGSYESTGRPPKEPDQPGRERVHRAPRALGFVRAKTGDPLEITQAGHALIDGYDPADLSRLNTHFGPRAVLIPGLGLCIVGLVLLSRVPVHGGYVVDLLPSMLLFGLGAGLSFPALTIVAMADATPDDAGLVSGLINTALQVGGALGLSVLATLSAARTGSLLAGGEDSAAALTGGYHLGFTVAVILVVAAAVVAVAALRPATSIAAGTMTDEQQEAVAA
jgi:hypothetical protein